MISDLTYKIVTYRSIEQVNNEDCVDWAMEMLELGYETHNLIILAGCNSSNPNLKSYLSHSIIELDLTLFDGDRATISYAYYHIKKIAEGKDVKLNIEIIHNLCQQRNYTDNLNDFYFLYWAWNDIDYDDNYPTQYWEGANKNNIQHIVISYCRKWLLENETFEIQKKSQT